MSVTASNRDATRRDDRRQACRRSHASSKQSLMIRLYSSVNRYICYSWYSPIYLLNFQVYKSTEYDHNGHIFFTNSLPQSPQFPHNNAERIAPIQASPNFNSLTTDTILGRDIVVNSRCSTPEQLEEDSDEDEEMTPVPKIMGLPSDIDDLFCGTQDDVINPVALHIFRRPKFFNSKASQYASSEATWTGMAEGQPNYQVNFEYGRRIHESTSYTDGGWGQRDNAKLMSPGFNTGGAAQISLGRPVNDQQTESMAYAALHAHGRHSFQDYIPDALEPVKGKQRSVDAADTFEMAASTLTQGGERGAAK
ncbi:hypothetical protein FA15DRAFT_672000, partial [Coprinopsis marcescibilis]